MKKLLALISLVTFAMFSMNIGSASLLYGGPAKESVQIWCSPDLSELTRNLVSTYIKNNPEARINLTKVSEDEYGEMIHDPDAIGLISSQTFSAYSSEPVWRMVIGRDIYVPVMNPENPMYEEISSKGLSVEEFKAIYTGNEKAEEKPSYILHCWCIDDDSSLCCLANFLNTDPESIKTKKAKDHKEFLEKVCGDKYAIGFCKLTSILDNRTQLIDNRLAFVPIDLNDNDNIDHFENIYTNTANLERGVWIGKYPRVLYSNIFAVSGSSPSNDEERAFLQWLSSEGQKFITAGGHSGLILSERISNIEKLGSHEATIAAVETKPSGLVNILLFIGLAIVLVLLIYLLFRIFNTGKEEPGIATSSISSMFGETSVEVPEGLFFDKTHTWTFMEKDGKVRTGIDDFLQHVTGPITKVIMKNPGEKIVKGQTYITLIQDGKQLEIQSPVTGTIVEKNTNLLSDSSVMNKNPYSDGWIYMVETPDWIKEIRTFFMGESYRLWLKNEFLRLKDFLAFTAKAHNSENVHTVLQEGGELKEGLLEFFGPEVWEEFQTRFIKNSR